ncbi:hypothetical protein [Burkholderia cepacia]|uniref:hypothetical protein n=1 Tax=Burkholderia cepacia TaxID=292 RepID=UPI00398E4EA4
MAFMLVFSISAFAQQVDDKCDSPYQVVYGNGILNNFQDIESGAQAVAALLGNKVGGGPVYYSFFPNESNGFLDDLMVVFRQKMADHPNLTWEILARVAGGLVDGILPETVDLVRTIIGDSEKEAASKVAEQFKAKYVYVDDRVEDAVSKVNDYILNKGRRVLLVGHSQGSLYANATHRIVYTNPKIRDGNFKVVHVASVANFVAGGEGYITSDSDLVVKALRTAMPDTLQSNMMAPFNPKDVSGHLFLDTYLNGDYPLRNSVFGLISKTLLTLKEPDSSFDYAITLSEYRTFSAGEGDATYEPQIWCDGILKAWQFCVPRDFIGYIRDADGREYDPRHSPEFGAVSAAALARLQQYAPEASNPDSALYRLVSAQWPRLTVSLFQTIENNGAVIKHASSDYDEGMNFSPLPPSEMYYPPREQFTVAYPLPYAVSKAKLNDPLVASVSKLKGKVSFEQYDGEILVFPWLFDIPMTRVKHEYKLRICKNSQSGNA